MGGGVLSFEWCGAIGRGDAESSLVSGCVPLRVSSKQAAPHCR